jgi:uncharacterized protein involved in response to NO
MTCIVMLRTAAARGAGAALPPRATAALVALVGAAAVLRILAVFLAAPVLLPLAAAAWAGGMALALGILVPELSARPAMPARAQARNHLMSDATSKSG